MNNFNKLFNQNHVKIINGITLRKKIDGGSSDASENHLSTCTEQSRSLMEEINGKVASFMNTYVMEFDLSSMLANGKVA